MSTILIGGGSGLVGKRLSQLLIAKGHKVLHLSRHRNLNAAIPTYQWDINTRTIDEEAVERADFVINLAGAGIADKRWTAARKELIIESRVKTTALLRDSIAKLAKPPKAFLSAAAVGYYGDRGAEWVDENSGPGDDASFLVESCLAWEKAIKTVADTGIRTVSYRIGVVISTKGGALPKMMFPAKIGLSSVIGSGEQYMSWIHIDDLCQMFIKGIEDENMKGVFNAVAPHPATNRVFTKTLANVLNRPAMMLPAPTPILRLAMGEMADVVLTGNRVSAEKIIKSGFVFQFPELAAAFQDAIERDI